MRSPLFRILILVLLLYSQLFLPLLAKAEGEDDPLWNRPSFEKKVVDIGQRILAANGITDRIVFLYDKEDIRNASASRYGGPNTIRVYKDMLDVVSSDDELAAVLGHEIAHITKRHTGKIMPKKIGTRLLLGTAFTAVGTAAIIATGGLAAPAVVLGGRGLKNMRQNGIDVTGPIERPYEKEADLVGLDYMVKAGYNPMAMETMFMKFAGDSGPVANFFADHPGGTERLAYIHEAIKTKYPQFLRADTMNSPLPGSPYQFQPSTPNGKSAPSAIPATTEAAANSTAATPSPAASVQPDAEKSTATEAQSPSSHAETSPASASAAPSAKTATLPSAATSTASAAPRTAVTIQPPGKINYQAPQQALLTPPKPAAQANPAAKASAESAGAHHSPSTANAPKRSAQPDASASVAQVLLSLSADDLHALTLISRHRYLSREEFAENFEHQEPDTVQQMLIRLVDKRLIRIVGAAPNEGYVLTDWALDALSPQRAGAAK